MTIFIAPDCPPAVERMIREKHQGARILGRSLIPADTRQDRAELAKRRAAAPLKPAKPQEPCDVGLFSDAAQQLDLVDQARRK